MATSKRNYLVPVEKFDLYFIEVKNMLDSPDLTDDEFKVWVEKLILLSCLFPSEVNADLVVQAYRNHYGY